jgi:sugar lactone lactonase YvrE
MTVCPGSSLYVGLASLAMVGCGSADVSGDSAWRGTVDTLPSGTIVVANRGAPVSASAPRVTEELRIGSMMGEGPEAFGNVRALLVDDEQRIYVLDSQAQEIRVFAPDGQFLHAIGRRGEGPGELKDAAAMGWGPAGELRVVDMGNARISVFSPTGEFLESHQQRGGFSMYPWPGVFEADGGLITVAPLARNGEFAPVLLDYDPAMQVTDTLEMPEFSGEANAFELSGEGGRIVASVPYAAGLTWDLDADGNFWVAPNTAEYRVHKIDAAGDTLLTITRPYEPIPVTASEVDSAVAQMKWFTDQGGRIDRSKFPSHKPSLSRLFVTRAGYLMVSPTTREPGSGWQTMGSRLDVFEPSGRYVGRLELPDGMRIANPEPVFEGDRVYGVLRDELDVPYVVRLRLQDGALAG